MHLHFFDDHSMPLVAIVLNLNEFAYYFHINKFEKSFTSFRAETKAT